jgi:hypothetical protein
MSGMPVIATVVFHIPVSLAGLAAVYGAGYFQFSGSYSP